MVMSKRYAILMLPILILVLSAVAQAQSGPYSTFTTVGLGQAVIEADQIVISIGIETVSNTAEQAHIDNQSIVEAIKESLKKLGIEPMKFVYKKVNIWQQKSTLTKEVTYKATSGLDVLFYDDTVIGKIVDKAFSLGASSIQGVKFQASDLSGAKAEALDLAVADAIGKADIISKATGMRIVGIRRVTDSNIIRITNPGDTVLVEGGYLTQSTYQKPVQRGEVLVEVEITIEFEAIMTSESGNN
jgi:uncharacterized protein YggE